MMRQSVPTRVMPPPPAVPREMVTYSRMVLSSPMSQRGGLAGVLEVLRGDAEAGEGVDAIAAAHGEVAVEHDVGDEFAVFAEDDVGADGAEGADGAAGGDLRASATIAVGWMLTRLVSTLVLRASSAARGTSWHMMVASQTSLPSTVMMPCILTARVRQLRTVTSMRSWSPGVTGRRKRASSMPVKTMSLASRSGISVSRRAPPAWAMASTIRTPGMMG